MIAPDIAVLGAGPHGREISRLRYGHGWVLFDDNPQHHLEPINQGAATHQWVIGAAWPWVRAEMSSKIHRLDEPIYPPWCRGIVVMRGAQVSEEVEVGAHVHFGQNAVVSHGCEIGDFVTVCPGAVLSGEVRVGAGSLIGAGAVVVHGGVTIGRHAKIGAGAVVLKDVPEDAVMVGNPAMRVK